MMGEIKTKILAYSLHTSANLDGVAGCVYVCMWPETHAVMPI